VQNQALTEGDQLDRPATVQFPNKSQLTAAFNERTYTLLRVIRDKEPDSIRDTARVIGRDKKNVHGELTILEALGVIRFETVRQGKSECSPMTILSYRRLHTTPESKILLSPDIVVLRVF
jgi:predicted transcriptional regulator